MIIPPYVLQAIEEILDAGCGEIVIKVHRHQIVSVTKSFLRQVPPPEKQPGRPK